MPEWLRLLHVSIASQETPKYVRFFLARMVLHVDRRHYEYQQTAQRDTEGNAAQVSTYP